LFSLDYHTFGLSQQDEAQFHCNTKGTLNLGLFDILADEAIKSSQFWSVKSQDLEFVIAQGLGANLPHSLALTNQCLISKLLPLSPRKFR